MFNAERKLKTVKSISRPKRLIFLLIIYCMPNSSNESY